MTGPSDDRMPTDPVGFVVGRDGVAGGPRAARGSRMVRCPICMDLTAWPDGRTAWRWDAKTSLYQLEDLSKLDPARRNDELRRSYQPCDNPSATPDAPKHYLPATYGFFDDPLVVGLVGASQSGKSHLLTAMIREVMRGGLSPYGLVVEPLDFRRHDEFRRNHLVPFERGEQLTGTGYGVTEYAESLVLRGPTGVHPLIFFDVAGEELQQPDDRGRVGRFLVAVNALLFVHAPEDALTQREVEERTGRSSVGYEDEAFRASLSRVTAGNPHHTAIPAVVAVTKSDRLRFRPPADFWLRRGSESTVNAARIRAESRDVYAFLHATGAQAALDPFEVFDRCALHFVSASGGDVAVGSRRGVMNGATGSFPRGVRPRRVLEPLVSILAMAGVLPGSESEKVGLP